MVYKMRITRVSQNCFCGNYKAGWVWKIAVKLVGEKRVVERILLWLALSDTLFLQPGHFKGR